MAKRLISIITTLALLGTGQALAASSPPFVDNGNGTVTDTSTGLMWDQCAAGLSGNGTCTTGTYAVYSWANTLGLAVMKSAANYKGYSDWRMPTIFELISLVKAGGPPTIDATAFPNTPVSGYWTASADGGGSGGAWYVGFSDGVAYNFSSNSITFPVRLVRAGQYFGAFGLFPVGISGVTASAATLSATSAVAATGSWLVVPRNATPPSAAQIIAGGASYAATTGTVSIAAFGAGAMTAKTPATFPVSGLAAGTAYDLYMVAKDAVANAIWVTSSYQTTSNVAGPLPFSTVAIATSSIVIDPSTPATLYAALDGSGVYVSGNSGGNWTSITTAGLTNLNVRALVMQNSNTLFAATYDGGVFKGTLGTGVTTWAACGTGLGAARLRSLTLDASGNLYAGSETGVFKGSTACGAWVAINNGLPN